MHIDRRFLGWGVFFILLGGVPLAVRAGYLTEAQVASWWSLWPLILIGIGVSVLLSRTRLEVLGGLVIASAFGLMAGGLFALGGQGLPGTFCGSDSGEGNGSPSSGTFSGPADVRIELDCGDLTVDAVVGTGWDVDATSTGGTEPEVIATATSLIVRSASDGPRVFPSGQRDTWRVSLPTDIPFTLDLQVNAGSARVDLGGARLQDVTVQLNAGSVRLDLGSLVTVDDLSVHGNAGSATIVLPNVSVTGSFELNAGSMRFCAPAGAALRIRTNDSIVASYDYDGHGLVRTGTTWETPGFTEAEVRIDLRTQANAGSFSLESEGACDD